MKISSIIILLSFQSFGFNWNICRKYATRGNGLGYFLSTTSYVTSTGDCAMIGEKSHDEKIFFAQNFDEIKIDVARGGGEYLSAFNSYSNCQGQNRELQSSYESIFVPDIESSFKNLKKFSCN